MTTRASGDWRLAVYGSRGSNTEQQRMAPRKADRERVLATQGDVCLYCGIPIGTVIGRVVISRGRTRQTAVTLRRNWDHFVPYSYCLQNPGSNWVVACHVCNLIKRARLYATVEEARHAILPRREELGYEAVQAAGLRAAILPAPSKPERGKPKRPRFEPSPRPQQFKPDASYMSAKEAAAAMGLSGRQLGVLRLSGKAPKHHWYRDRMWLERASVAAWIQARDEDKS